MERDIHVSRRMRARVREVGQRGVMALVATRAALEFAVKPALSIWEQTWEQFGNNKRLDGLFSAVSDVPTFS